MSNLLILISTYSLRTSSSLPANHPITVPANVHPLLGTLSAGRSSTENGSITMRRSANVRPVRVTSSPRMRRTCVV